MNAIKKTAAACLILLTTASVFANKPTIQTNQSKSQEISQWKFASKDDGMFFILGEYTKKLLVIQINKAITQGLPADFVTVSCNASNEDIFRQHRLKPGSTLTCKGNFNDIASMSIDPQDFKNGAEGIYEFKPLEK